MRAPRPGYPIVMEPIPETFEALEEFGAYLYDGDLLADLGRMGARVQEIVPDCVGLSLAYREHGVTFTLVATDEITAALDALQYLDDGPCVTAVDEARPVAFSTDDVLDEGLWHLFARGTTAAAVAGALTLPIRVDEKVVGSVNLYADSPDAFEGKHQQVARALGAWPEGAIVNADLDFTTRSAAEDAPRQLFEETRIHVAVGILRVPAGRRASGRPGWAQGGGPTAGVSEAAVAQARHRAGHRAPFPRP